EACSAPTALSRGAGRSSLLRQGRGRRRGDGRSGGRAIHPCAVALRCIVNTPPLPQLALPFFLPRGVRFCPDGPLVEALAVCPVAGSAAGFFDLADRTGGFVAAVMSSQSANASHVTPRAWASLTTAGNVGVRMPSP